MRIVLILSPHSYRAPAFLAAARRLGVEVVQALDVPPGLPDFTPNALPLDFRDPERAARQLTDYAAAHPLDAIVPIDDDGTLIAALASTRLGLPFNAPDAARAAHDKALMRARLAAAHVPSPRYLLCDTAADAEALSVEVAYPCVLKPCTLSASRGVMRADAPAEFERAFARLRGVLACERDQRVLVEDFIPGVEVALEGLLLADGGLRVLALFDKPDPLDGPFFEETLYVTPSRLPAATQAEIAACAAQACRALGLQVGPVHAELRVNAAGPWIVEVAGRSIGGLCARTLRFGADAALEELIIRQAVGLPLDGLARSGPPASGVYMIPIPRAGILQAIEGLDSARAVPGVDSIEITASLHLPIRPLPEGDSYLGFIFASGATPEAVEASLRAAHAALRVVIEEEILLVI